MTTLPPDDDSDFLRGPMNQASARPYDPMEDLAGMQGALDRLAKAALAEGIAVRQVTHVVYEGMARLRDMVERATCLHDVAGVERGTVCPCPCHRAAWDPDAHAYDVP